MKNKTAEQDKNQMFTMTQYGKIINLLNYLSRQLYSDIYLVKLLNRGLFNKAHSNLEPINSISVELIKRLRLAKKVNRKQNSKKLTNNLSLNDQYMLILFLN